MKNLLKERLNEDVKFLIISYVMLYTLIMNDDKQLNVSANRKFSFKLHTRAKFLQKDVHDSK